MKTSSIITATTIANSSITIAERIDAIKENIKALKRMERAERESLRGAVQATLLPIGTEVKVDAPCPSNPYSKRLAIIKGSEVKMQKGKATGYEVSYIIAWENCGIVANRTHKVAPSAVHTIVEKVCKYAVK